MAIEEQAQLASELHVWLVEKYDQGADGGDLVAAVALVLGDMLGQQAVNGEAIEAEVLSIVLEQRFATKDAEEAMPEEDEGFEIEDEDEENEGDKIEGEDEGEGGDEGFNV